MEKRVGAKMKGGNRGENGEEKRNREEKRNKDEEEENSTGEEIKESQSEDGEEERDNDGGYEGTIDTVDLIREMKEQENSNYDARPSQFRTVKSLTRSMGLLVPYSACTHKCP